jgi:DNA polymerase-3 subunit delta
MVSPEKLLQSITAGKFKPAYYFFGEEDYRIAEAIKFLARKYLSEAEFRTNFLRFDARKISTRDLISELCSLSLLGDKRVLVVANFQSYKPNEWKAILAALAQPDATRLVIMTSPSSVLVRGRGAFVKKVFFKGVSGAIETVEFNRQTPAEMAGQVKRRLRRADLEIDSDALRLLTEMLSGNRGGFQGEVDKLINYKQSGETVTVDDIKQICCGYEVFNIFDLADRIVERQTRLVLKMVDKLLSDGSSPVMIGILLQQHFMNLLLVQGGHNPMGNKAWLKSKFLQQAGRYDAARLEQIVCDIARCDADLRGGNLKPEPTLEMLVLGLMSG